MNIENTILTRAKKECTDKKLGHGKSQTMNESNISTFHLKSFFTFYLAIKKRENIYAQ